MDDSLENNLTIDSVLDAKGKLSQIIDGFQTRDSQIEMAKIIHRSIQDSSHAVIEAGTGIGKSFAYLVPAFISATKTLISTGTKNLQDQLYNKDIPIVRKAIAKGVKTALLKGRSNYACLYRINKYRAKRHFQTPKMSRLFKDLGNWSASSVVGDIAEFSKLPERDSLWFFATSNSENCLGQECPDYAACFVLKARKNAFDADIVVINHHLFFSDLALREDGFGELLPDMDMVIFDEAHQLPDIASHFFGRGITMRQITQLSKDIIDAQLMEAPDEKDLVSACYQLQKTAADFRLVIGEFPQKGEWQIFQNATKLKQAINDLQDGFNLMAKLLEPAASRGKELLMCFERLEELIDILKSFMQTDTDNVIWYEWGEQSFRLMLTPIDISNNFQTQIDRCQFRTQIYTSATLSSQQSFDYFNKRLGLIGLNSNILESPFNYQKQALLYLPKNLPEPSSDQFLDAFCEECIRLINLYEGNTFVLFTSYWVMQRAAEVFRRTLSNTFFVQGEQQRSELLNNYLISDRAVLLGTSSFWEGIDVKGDKLQCVIIDKLPFKSPSDPVYKKRLSVANQQGNAFMDVQIPEATISLKQGVGRLIRDIGDTGVVMLADARLTKKTYGEYILASLPKMTRVEDFSEVKRFKENLKRLKAKNS